jgi:DinB superfamily
MVLTKPELVSALKKEVRILLHLAGKLDITQLDYRPTPKQRSALELLRYLSYMGPRLVATAKNGTFDGPAWQSEVEAAEKRNLDETLEAIAALPDKYERLLADMSDADFRAEMTGFDGSKLSRGAFIVSLVLGGHAAYRTQLFCYLKACGHEQLGTVNLWRGSDAPAPV